MCSVIHDTGVFVVILCMFCGLFYWCIYLCVGLHVDKFNTTKYSVSEVESALLGTHSEHAPLVMDHK